MWCRGCDHILAVYSILDYSAWLEDTPIKVHWTDNLGDGVHKKLGGYQKIATAQVGEASFQFPLYTAQFHSRLQMTRPLLLGGSKCQCMSTPAIE